ncbi:hypothetical protein ACLX1H_001319 [Fusarium chlamydosporum]
MDVSPEVLAHDVVRPIHVVPSPTTITITTITTTTTDVPAAAAAAMPARLPDLGRLLALLERFLAPKGPGLPGGTMTVEEIERYEKGSPIKGEPVTEETWPAAAAADPPSSLPPLPSSPPPTTPPRKRRRGLLGRKIVLSSPPS